MSTTSRHCCIICRSLSTICVVIVIKCLNCPTYIGDASELGKCLRWEKEKERALSRRLQNWFRCCVTIASFVSTRNENINWRMQ